MKRAPLFLLGLALLLAAACGDDDAADPTAGDRASDLDAASFVGVARPANVAMPNADLTPGAVFPASAAEICVKGYSSKVRNVSTKTKNQAYASYGIASHSTGAYEVDHLISLELGGSNDIANLWPEPGEPRPGFHEKDQLENKLHDLVCRGEVDLATAQQEIATDWFAAWVKYLGAK